MIIMTTIIIIVIIIQGVSLSLKRKPPLHAFHNSLPFSKWLQVGPTYRIKSSHHLNLGRPRGILCPRGILVSLFSQLILLMVAYCRHDVNSLRDILSLCLAPLPSLNFSLPLWSCRTDVASLSRFRKGFKYASSTLWFFMPSKRG